MLRGSGLPPVHTWLLELYQHDRHSYKSASSCEVDAPSRPVLLQVSWRWYSMRPSRL